MWPIVPACWSKAFIMSSPQFFKSSGPIFLASRLVFPTSSLISAYNAAISLPALLLAAPMQPVLALDACLWSSYACGFLDSHILGFIGDSFWFAFSASRAFLLVIVTFWCLPQFWLLLVLPPPVFQYLPDLCIPCEECPPTIVKASLCSYSVAGSIHIGHRLVAVFHLTLPLDLAGYPPGMAWGASDWEGGKDNFDQVSNFDQVELDTIYIL